MHTEEELTSLAYRELQGIAKSCGVPANKKKEELVKLILIAQASSTPDVEAGSEPSGFSDDINPNNVSSPQRDDAIAVVPAEVASVQETSTVEQESVPEPELESSTYPEEEKADIVTQLTESFASAVRLQGLPTPCGTHTVFDEASPVPPSKVDWGFSFQSPVKSTCTAVFTPAPEDDCENQHCNVMSTATTPEVRKILPQGAHTYFLSPDVQKSTDKVHWHYEDYDIEAQTTQPAKTPLKTKTPAKMALSVTNTPALKAPPNTPGTLSTAQKMQFWLSKSGVTPAKTK